MEFESSSGKPLGNSDLTLKGGMQNREPSQTSEPGTPVHNKLEDARRRIDELDDRLLELFLERMHTSEEIGYIKLTSRLPLFQPGREDAVLKRMAASCPPQYSGYVTAFFHNLMEQSKRSQREILRPCEKDSPFDLAIRMPVQETQHPRVMAQGVLGAYSGSAAMQLYPEGNLAFVPEWGQVFSAIQDGTADYGVLPVENSSSGSVFEVFDLMLKYKFYIVKALGYHVRHYLLGVRGAKLSDIREVYTNPYAFPQCTTFLESYPRMHRNPYANTALAAEYVAKTGDMTKAAIASRENAHLYGLDILAENIQDCDTNCTRFVSVAKNAEFSTDANKISLVFTVPHVTGSLCRTLAHFANAGLNLTKIESRPNPSHAFEYYFYVDFTGAVRSEGTRALLGSFSRELPNFYFFGNYYEY